MEEKDFFREAKDAESPREMWEIVVAGLWKGKKASPSIVFNLFQWTFDPNWQLDVKTKIEFQTIEGWFKDSTPTFGKPAQIKAFTNAFRKSELKNWPSDDEVIPSHKKRIEASEYIDRCLDGSLKAIRNRRNCTKKEGRHFTENIFARDSDEVLLDKHGYWCPECLKYLPKQSDKHKVFIFDPLIIEKDGYFGYSPIRKKIRMHENCFQNLNGLSKLVAIPKRLLRPNYSALDDVVSKFEKFGYFSIPGNIRYEKLDIRNRRSFVSVDEINDYLFCAGGERFVGRRVLLDIYDNFMREISIKNSRKIIEGVATLTGPLINHGLIRAANTIIDANADRGRILGSYDGKTEAAFRRRITSIRGNTQDAKNVLEFTVEHAANEWPAKTAEILRICSAKTVSECGESLRYLWENNRAIVDVENSIDLSTFESGENSFFHGGSAFLGAGVAEERIGSSSLRVLGNFYRAQLFKAFFDLKFLPVWADAEGSEIKQNVEPEYLIDRYIYKKSISKEECENIRKQTLGENIGRKLIELIRRIYADVAPSDLPPIVSDNS